MRAFKSQAFESGDEIKDVFSQKALTEKQAASKELYGDQWANHSAETDHITPVKELHDKYNKNPFLKDDDLKDVANKDTNFSLKSKSSNASKRDSTNNVKIFVKIILI